MLSVVNDSFLSIVSWRRYPGNRVRSSNRLPIYHMFLFPVNVLDSDSVLLCVCVCCSDSTMPVTSRVCFVRFNEQESVGVSQHLTNTVFVDRALIVVPYAEGWYLRAFALTSVTRFLRQTYAQAPADREILPRQTQPMSCRPPDV